MVNKLDKIFTMFILKRRCIANLVLLIDCVHGILVFHKEKRTWSDAQSVCSQDGGALVTTYTSADILRLTSATDTVWEGRYYSPWAWLIGCYSNNDSSNSIDLKRNQLKECLNHCNTNNYFGLQNKKCFCFDTFNGEFKRTEDECNYICPGNSEERCGGPQALTIYMNDICYKNSSEWQGTISKTFSGKQCLPWVNITAMQTNKVAVFPDGSADNASNFCRDPTNKTYLWCHVSQDEIEQCDIPKCIAKESVYPCMSFRKAGKIFYFTQENCNTLNAALCETSKHTFLLDRNIRTWTGARDQNRHSYYRDSGVTYYCYMLAGPGIFRLKTNIQDYRVWFAYSRNINSVSTIVPSRKPQQCFGMFYYSGSIRSTIKNCDEERSFICQYEKVTCGEDFNMSLNGTLVTPGYLGKGYDHNGRCVWRISVPEDYTINLSINISIENTYTCRSDFLRIFTGNYGNGVSFCGDLDDVYDIAGNNVTIEFRSDGTIDGKGANITWVAVPVVTETTKSIIRDISTIYTPLSTRFDIFITEDPNGHGNRFLIAGIPGETIIGIIVGLLVVFGAVFCVIFVWNRRRHANGVTKVYNSMLQISDNDDSSEKPRDRNLNHNISSGSEIVTGRSSIELYHSAVFGNETSITESSSNVYHNQSVDEKQSSVGNISNIYDNTSLERNTSIVEDDEHDFLGEKDQVSPTDGPKILESTKIGSSVQQKSNSSEEIGSVTADDYNRLNEVIRNEYQNEPEVVYTNHSDSDCTYDQTTTCRRQSHANSVDLTNNNMYDHFTNYQVEYSKASSCGRKKVEDSMALTDKLTYDFLTKSE